MKIAFPFEDMSIIEVTHRMVGREEETDTPEPLIIYSRNAVADSLLAISFGVIVGLVVLAALI